MLLTKIAGIYLFTAAGKEARIFPNNSKQHLVNSSLICGSFRNSLRKHNKPLVSLKRTSKFKPNIYQILFSMKNKRQSLLIQDKKLT